MLANVDKRQRHAGLANDVELNRRSGQPKPSQLTISRTLREMLRSRNVTGDVYTEGGWPRRVVLNSEVATSRPCVIWSAILE